MVNDIVIAQTPSDDEDQAKPAISMAGMIPHHLRRPA
jgi:hypothetical protein